MSRCWLPAVVGALVWAVDLAAAEPPGVHAWQDSIQLPTYRLGPASPDPQYPATTPGVANYPYPLLNNLTTDKQDRVWRTLNLENEYLFCRILPDLGGHLYSCRDKRNNREMFYANPVIKPSRDMGLLGAWAAFGIESTFPLGHTRVSLAPVDSAVQQESDGSGRAVVEETDRVTGMEWRVEYILRPGSTLLEQRVTLYNRTAVRWPYYWWANAGVAFDDPAMRVILPAHVVSTHTTPAEIVPWPVTPGGKDGALIANHKTAGGWFAYRSREPFFAIYKPAFRSGLAHFADPNLVPGKKLWLWGAGQDEWVKHELTDNFPSYVEVQAGRFQNQDTFEFLQPQQVVQFSEFWIPVCDMGGVTRVTRDVILNLQRHAETPSGLSLQIELSATHAIHNATLLVADGRKSVFHTKVNLDPGVTYSKILENPADSPYTVQLVDPAGAILLHDTEDWYDADTPDRVKLGVVPKPYPEGENEPALLARGMFHELNEQWKDAWSDYSAGVRKFPGNLEIAKTDGTFALNLNRFDEAARLLGPVVTSNPADASSTYGLGLAQAMLGEDERARKTLAKIPSIDDFGPAAALQLGLLSARAKDDARALAILKPLAGQHSGAVKIGALVVALLRRSGQRDEATKLLNSLYAADPADTTLRFERVLLGSDDEDLWKHLAVDGERVLNLVDEYLSLGSDADALRLLSQSWPALAATDVPPGAVPAANDPLIAYYRAFIHARMGQDTTEDLRAAAAGSMQYVFPNRWSSLAVLNSALKANHSDARAHFLLGRLLLDQMKVDEALEQWQEAARLNPALPELQRDLAQLLSVVKKDSTGHMVVKESAPPPVQQSQVEAPPPPKSASEIDIATAAMLKAAAGKPDEAASMFDPHTFSAEKQPDPVRQAWIEVQLQRLLAMARARKCTEAMTALLQLGNEDTNLGFTLYGFGKFTKLAHFQYYSATLEADCHDEKDARKHLAKVTKMSDALPSPEFVFPLLAAVRLAPTADRSAITAALDTVRAALAKADPATRPSLIYVQAMLLRASGKNPEAMALLRTAAKSGDTLVQYLALTEMARTPAAQ